MAHTFKSVTIDQLETAVAAAISKLVGGEIVVHLDGVKFSPPRPNGGRETMTASIEIASLTKWSSTPGRPTIEPI